MSLDQPSDPNSVVALSTHKGGRAGQQVVTSFHRRELTLILNVYGQMLSCGMARDYAIDHLKDIAVFSIFWRASENPLFRIEKRPKDANRQGAWTVVSTAGGTLKRGRDLAQVLRVFDRFRMSIVD